MLYVLASIVFLCHQRLRRPRTLRLIASPAWGVEFTLHWTEIERFWNKHWAIEHVWTWIYECQIFLYQTPKVDEIEANKHSVFLLGRRQWCVVCQPLYNFRWEDDMEGWRSHTPKIDPDGKRRSFQVFWGVLPISRCHRPFPNPNVKKFRLSS